MTTKDYTPISISIKNTQFTKHLSTTNMDLLFTAIKHGFWKVPITHIREYPKGSPIYQSHKSSLPMIYMVDYKVKDQGVEEGVEFQNNGLLIFDIDVYDEEPVQEAIKWVHKNLNACLLMMFRSPTGGLKFIIKTDIITDEFDLHSFAYNELGALFQRKGLNVEIDTKTSNVNRGTYVSWDENAYYNPKCKTMNVLDKFVTRYEEQKEKEAAKRAAAAKFIVDAEFDERHARNSLRIKLESIFSGTFQGSRNHNMYLVSKACFDCNFGIDEAVRQLDEMAFRGLSDPDVKNHFKAAQRHHHAWIKKGHQPNPKFFKGTAEAEEELLASRMKAIFKN